jgi:hypothetical protein
VLFVCAGRSLVIFVKCLFEAKLYQDAKVLIFVVNLFKIGL